MTRLVWDDDRVIYGVSNGVYYPESGPGVAWNGLVTVKENAEAEEQTRYTDGVKTHRQRLTETFSGTIEAYTYPDVFYDDIIKQHRPKSFGLSYQVQTPRSYIIHLIYNVLVLPSQFVYQYAETDHFSWDFGTLPEKIPGGKSSAHLFIDAEQSYPEALTAIENILYGSEVGVPRLPLPEEIFSLFDTNALLIVTDHGDGTFTVDGPDEVIFMIDSTTFEITSPGVVYVNDDEYQVRSW